MVVESHITPDCFLHVPESLIQNSSRSRRSPTLIFFITGNPGLISYYHPFLSLLTRPALATGDQDAGFDTSQCVIAGFSLAGFELEDTAPFHSLQDQISLTTSRLQQLVTSLRSDFSAACTDPFSVILVGHSVGAFISLEVIRNWHQKWRSNTPGPVGAGPSSQDAASSTSPYVITGAILLTPTIIDIAKSHSGRIATPLLTRIPFLPNLAAAFTKVLKLALPEQVLKWLVATATGMTEPALSTTVAFLKSERGVMQSLRMARDEMIEITGDRWGKEVWAIASEESHNSSDHGHTSQLHQPPKLVLYFAAKDHWVADETREQIMTIHGCGTVAAGPKMIVEEEGKLVHGWCITQSDLVAQKVRLWVGEILGQGRWQ